MRLNTMEITGGIFNNLTLLKGAQDITNGNYITQWDGDTLFNCDFITIYGGNPAGYNVDNISFVETLEQKNEVGSETIYLPVTQDGKDMSKISALLNEAIGSVIHVKENSDIDSLFGSGGTSADSQKRC